MEYNAPELIQVEFARDGQKNEIPLSSSDPSSNLASFTTGFKPITMTPRSAGGKPPQGQDFNGILNILSAHIRFMNGGGRYRWDDEYVAAVGGYAKGSVIQSDDGEREYISQVDNNTDNFNEDPSVIGTSWKLTGGGDGVPIGIPLPSFRKVVPPGYLSISYDTETFVPRETYKQVDELCYCGDDENDTADFFFRCTDQTGTVRAVDGPYIALPAGALYFLRGLDPSGTRSRYKYQADALQTHVHEWYVTNPGALGSAGPAASSNASTNQRPLTSTPVAPRDGVAPRLADETRPMNIACDWIIKVADEVTNQEQIDFAYVMNEIQWLQAQAKNILVPISESGEVEIFVSVTGDDNNDGLSANRPVASIKKAIDIAYGYRNLSDSSASVYINIASGTYTEDLYLYASGLNTTIALICDNVTLNGFIQLSFGGTLSLNGTLTINAVGKTYAVAASYGSYVRQNGNLSLILSSTTTAFYANYGATIAIHAGVTIRSSAASIIYYAADRGQIYAESGKTITAAVPCYCANGFAYAQMGGIIRAQGQTFPGTWTGRRYYNIACSVMQTAGGVNFFPGSVAGTSDASSYYS